MTQLASPDAYSVPDAYGVLTEPASLKIQRLLPGPIERVWAYLTQSELRRQWLAAGQMDTRAGAEFEFVWRNDELTDPPGQRPPGFPEERRMRSRVIAVDPPRRLVIAWGAAGEVSFRAGVTRRRRVAYRHSSPRARRTWRHCPSVTPTATCARSRIAGACLYATSSRRSSAASRWT